MSTYHRTTLDLLKTSTSHNVVGQKRKHDDGTRHSDIRNSDDFSRPSYPDTRREVTATLLKASEILNVMGQGPTEYSQRRSLALTPNPTLNPLLDLSHPAYALPPQLVANLASLGIKSIYPWQSDCLLRSGTLSRQKNLVYTAPTGGGKSLVADVLMLKSVIDNPGQKALLVLPYGKATSCCFLHPANPDEWHWFKRNHDG